MSRSGRSVGPRTGGGTSLLEVLLAIVIVGVVVGPMVHFMLTSQRGIVIPRQEMLAVNLCDEVLSAVASAPYAEVPVSREPGFVPQQRWGAATFAAAPGPVPATGETRFDVAGFPPCPEGYERALSIEERPLEPDPEATARVKIVRVRVAWTKAGRGDGEVVLATCVASPR